MNILELLKIAIDKRKCLSEICNAYRIVNGAGDNLPGVTVDKFSDHYQVQFFDKTLLNEEKKIVEALKELCAPHFLAIKYRLSPAGYALEHPKIHVECGESSKTIVQEGNCKFNVDLLDTVNPGLFLDMRDVRLDVQKRVSGIEVLNLFSYTCSFGVHARKGDAIRAVNADISGKILEKGRSNYALNGIDVKPGEFFKGNAFEYLAWAKKKGMTFGGIVLDPPSFARFKGFSFNVRKDFSKLLLECGNVLAPGGFLMASSNYSGFDLKTFGKNALGVVQTKHSNARLEWTRSQGIDFTGSGLSKETCLCAAMIVV